MGRLDVASEVVGSLDVLTGTVLSRCDFPPGTVLGIHCGRLHNPTDGTTVTEWHASVEMPGGVTHVFVDHNLPRVVRQVEKRFARAESPPLPVQAAEAAVA